MRRTDFDYLLVATFMDRFQHGEREEQYRRELALEAERHERRRAQLANAWRKLSSHLRRLLGSQQPVTRAHGLRSLESAT